MSPALDAPAEGQQGVASAAWHEALQAHLQQQMELAVLRLARAGSALLSEGGPKFVLVDVTWPLPAGENVRFVASLELVEG